jgi:hypothetical protein
MARERSRRISTGTLTGTALLLALGVVLPIVFHAIPLGGRVFLPMHLPTFVAGLVLGPVAGLVVGAGSPVLSALLTGRPSVFYMVPMLFELATYGIVAGLLRPRVCSLMARRTRGAASEPSEGGGNGGYADTTNGRRYGGCGRPTTAGYAGSIWLSLLAAMVAGRIVWIAVVVWLAPVIGLQARTIAMALGAIGAGWIGMVIQLALIPAIVRAIERPGRK